MLNENGNTPLYVAVEKGHHEIAKLLLKLGAKVNSKNEFDNTPLHIAMMKGGKLYV